MNAEPQYIESIKKGDTVSYGNRSYRVQDDRGYLHIIIFENGKRKKIGIEKLLLFDYGSEQDWIFNGWFEKFSEYETFRQFAEHEKQLF